MKVVCPKCGKSEFSVRKSMSEEINYKKGTGQVIKDLACDCCGTLFLATMDIEIKDVDIDFII